MSKIWSTNLQEFYTFSQHQQQGGGNIRSGYDIFAPSFMFFIQMSRFFNMLDQMCASSEYFILGMIGDLHDHHQGLLPEPVLLLTDVISKRRFSHYGFLF